MNPNLWYYITKGRHKPDIRPNMETARPAHTTDVPEFHIQYTTGRPSHVVMLPDWNASDGTGFSSASGMSVFTALHQHYEMLKPWRQDCEYITTYRPLPVSFDVEEVIELVLSTQEAIVGMLDDWLWIRDMITCHQDQIYVQLVDKILKRVREEK